VPEDSIQGLAIIADLGPAFTFGGTPGPEDGMALIYRAVMSGVLGFKPFEGE
jgi:hypothetical protein